MYSPQFVEKYLFARSNISCRIKWFRLSRFTCNFSVHFWLGNFFLSAVPSRMHFSCFFFLYDNDLIVFFNQNPFRPIGGSESQANDIINVCGWGLRHSTAALSEGRALVAVLSVEQLKPNDDPSKEFADAKHITDELLAIVQLRWSIYESKELCKNSVARATHGWLLL